jgi:membrane fusion protein (multidrug efflux system)
MNPIILVMRRLLTTLMLVVALLVVVLLSGGVLASNKLQAGLFPSLNMPKIYASLGDFGARTARMKDYVVGQVESWFHKHKEEHHEEARKVVVTSPKAMDVIITEQYVCQIHAQRHIEICALDNGYLDKILVKEGQAVKKDVPLFKLLPVLYKAKWDAKQAEARLAELEWLNTKSLAERKGVAAVSPNEVLLYEAKMKRAMAEAAEANAEFNFTELKAPFDGIVDKLHKREGSLIEERDILTTLSDNSVMWVYFNVPERAYLEYMAHREQHEKEDRIELKLANQNIFPQPGKIGAIEAKFNNETGNIPFRADFENPHRLLRHGQTGTILIHRTLKNAVVIPQRAIFELLDKRYVWVVDKDGVAHQRLITIKHELEDVFVINSGLDVNDKIVLEGVREVHEGAKVEYEFRKPEETLKNQKFHAE